MRRRSRGRHEWAPYARAAQDAAAGLAAAWGHRWESLATALRDVTEEEGAYQAECYRDEEREDGWPAPGTILWHVAHVAHCKLHYATLLERRGTSERPSPTPRTPRSTLAEERQALEVAHERQMGVVRALREEDLSLKVPNGMTVSEFLAHQIRHDTWHAAQIAVARRLWRTRPTAASRPG